MRGWAPLPYLLCNVNMDLEILRFKVRLDNYHNGRFLSHDLYTAQVRTILLVVEARLTSCRTAPTYLPQHVYRTFSMAWWPNHLLFFTENTQEMTALARAWEFLQSYHAKDVELERLCLWSHCSYQQAQDMVTPPRLAVSREKYLLIMKGSTF